MEADELTRMYITADWDTDREMPSNGNEYEANPIARWGEIFYLIDPNCTFVYELELTRLYRVVFDLPSGVRITIRKSNQRGASWQNRYWELHNGTDYTDARGRHWHADDSYNPLARVRPWARTARAVADDIQRRVIEPASHEHIQKLLDIEQINEGLNRQAHAAQLTRQLLGDTKPDAMYPNAKVSFLGNSLSVDTRILEGGEIEITKLTFADTETALDALETLFNRYEQAEQETDA